MANIKSQKKRILTNEKSRIRNISYKSKVKTAIKKVKVEVANKNKEKALLELKNTISLLDRAVVKGILHKKTVARKKSDLQQLVNSL